MQTLYEDLLRGWGDALLRLQLDQPEWPELHGGIMCPACARVHGRCADAVYPLLRLASTSGEARYLDGAVRVMAWSDNVSRADGAWYNDPVVNAWTGTTVFSMIALGEALRHYGGLLDDATRARWEKRTRQAAEFIFRTFHMRMSNINYPITGSAALALAGTLFNDERYLTRARELAHATLDFISPSGLLFGEGHPQDGLSARRCRPVDLGYNVEESLPALALYGRLTGDEAVLEATTEMLRAHLAFQLPDGGWDNSWGTRNFKWTYWGSRTSDGCSTGLLMLADRDPRFADAAHRNTALLAACTHDGLLYGGPHTHAWGIKPCVHHTFCHAKAIAASLDYGIPAATPSAPAQPSGVRVFPEILTWLVRQDGWRGTVTAYDWLYIPEGHVSGGTLSVLWHDKAGLLLAGGMAHYTDAIEAANMPPARDTSELTLAPQLRLQQGETTFSSLFDMAADVRVTTQEDGVTELVAAGQLADIRQQRPADACAYTLAYRFTADALTLQVTATRAAEFVLPIIAAPDEPVQQSDKTVEITKAGGRVVITASALPALQTRTYHHTPGCAAVPLVFQLTAGEMLTVTLHIGPTSEESV